MKKSTRCNEDMKIWLFDLAHDNLNDQEILKGFIKHYVLYDLTISDVHQDIRFHTLYGVIGTKVALNNLRGVLKEYAEKISLQYTMKEVGVMNTWKKIDTLFQKITSEKQLQRICRFIKYIYVHAPK